MTRKVLYSAQLSWKSVTACIVALFALILLDTTYKKSLFAFSISEDGIPKWQKKASSGELGFLYLMSKLGGGKEIGVLVFSALLLAPREKYFYYLLAWALDKLYIGYFKLAYGDPRPYMVNGEIHPYECTSKFGNPSGHSSAAQLFGFIVFLDVFHGKHYNFKKGLPNVTFASWAWYIFCLVLSLFWAITIPFSRWMLGVHSLDQIIYGTTLGWWTILTCHFVIRDNLLAHFVQVRKLHHEARKQSDSYKQPLSEDQNSKVYQYDFELVEKENEDFKTDLMIDGK